MIVQDKKIQQQERPLCSTALKSFYISFYTKKPS